MMSAMDILDLLTRPGTYVLGIAVYVLTFFTRRAVELVWPRLKKQSDANSPDITYLTTQARWWNEVVLYAVPVVYGAGSSLSASAFLFEGIDGGAKFMYGAGVGWFSSFLYKALKRAIANRVNGGAEGQKVITITEVSSLW
jgi:hypothetical protein